MPVECFEEVIEERKPNPKNTNYCFFIEDF
jgi:hypothetical protein